MDDTVPLISSSVVGPLGIAHLPRLWLKLLLHAEGRLADGYRHGNGGFDESLCRTFELDRDATIAFVEAEKPDYLAFEAWVSRNARNLTPERIATWNVRVRTANMNEAMAAERRERFGIDDAEFANAVILNDLDDWAGAHARITAKGASAP